jgi:hypothetical protein
MAAQKREARLVRLVVAIHVLDNTMKEDVDGRDKPGHDERRGMAS